MRFYRDTDLAGVSGPKGATIVQTIRAMKKSISLTSALPMLAVMLVSCSSGTTTTTTRQATTTAATTPDHRLPSQTTGYRDNNPETFWPTGR